MAGPEKQFDQDAVLNKALEVFWLKGFEATSIQDLVDKMGINRASLYQTYGNKSSLFKTALDRYITTSLVYMQQVLEAPGSPLENVYSIFMGMIEQGIEGRKCGCLINNTAVELGPHDAEIAEKIRNFWNEFEAIISRTLQRGIEQKELNEDLDTVKMASFINIALQGIVVKTKSNVAKQQLINDTDLVFALIKKSSV